MDLQAQIFSKSIPEPNSGCWLWTAAMLDGGYGICSDGERCVTAHRLSYRAFKGEIPAGKVVAHSCDVRSCVNPDHLRVATYKENSEEMVARGRSAKGEKCARSKLSNEEVGAIRASPLSQRALGKMFNVSKTAIAQIKQGKTWKAE